MITSVHGGRGWIGGVGWGWWGEEPKIKIDFAPFTFCSTSTARRNISPLPAVWVRRTRRPSASSWSACSPNALCSILFSSGSRRRKWRCTRSNCRKRTYRKRGKKKQKNRSTGSYTRAAMDRARQGFPAALSCCLHCVRRRFLLADQPLGVGLWKTRFRRLLEIRVRFDIVRCNEETTNTALGDRRIQTPTPEVFQV